MLDVSNLSISFTQYVQGLRQNKFNVIADLTLDIKEGEVFAILGSSGSGKSLLAHSILGILPANSDCSGDIYFKGEPLTDEKKELLRGDEICFIPQSVSYLDPLMKVADQAIGLIKDDKERETKRKKQRELFDKYGLSEEVDEMYPFQLSGGMTRKVLLCTALLSDPKLVVADEPTPGLDTKSIEETINNIKQMSEEGISVLLITHDINVAIKTANRIGVFYGGYIIEVNKSENFKDSSKLLHPYTKALVDALPTNGFNLTKGLQPLGDLEGCIYYENCEFRLDKCKDLKPDLDKIDDIFIRCHLGSGGENDS